MTHPAAAGAFMLPEGQGQFIAGVGYVESSRRFDRTGTAMPVDRYTKASASGYLEYGLTPGLGLILAPTLSRTNGVAANSVTGSDSSAFGVRLALYSTRTSIVALQVLVQPPLGGAGPGALADGGTRSFAVDLRVMLGSAFPAFGLPAFIDVEPGARVRADPFPTEARLDIAFGVRPSPRVLLLTQTFSVWAPPGGSALPRSSYTKAQATIVYDLSPRWSVQVGGFRTVTGCNAIRETGPLAAIWYRF